MGGPPFNKTKGLEVIFKIIPANHQAISAKILEGPNLMLQVVLVNLMVPGQYNVLNVEGGANPNACVHLS